jgi:hypothetical protein
MKNAMQSKPKTNPPAPVTDAKQVEAEKLDAAPAASVAPKAPGFTKREKTAGGERFSVKVVDGKFEVIGLRPQTESKLKEAFSGSFRDPEFRSWAGISAAESQQVAVELVPPALVGQVLDMAARAEAYILSGRTGLSYDECLRFLEFDKREHDSLDEQGAQVISRYIPAEWLIKADLYIFLSSLVSLTMIKIKALTDYAKSQQKSNVDKAIAGVERATKRQEARDNASAKTEIDVPVDHVEVLPPPPPAGDNGMPHGTSFEDAA